MSDRISTAGATMQNIYQMQTTQSRLSLLTNEISSGQRANPAGQLGSGASVLYQLQYDNDQQTTLQTSLTAASDQLASTQTVMTGIADEAAAMSTAALNFNASTPGAGMTALATQAQGALAQVVNLLNTQYSGQAMFSGDNGAAVPMAGADTISTGLQTILSNQVAANGGTALTAAQVTALVGGGTTAGTDNGIANFFGTGTPGSAGTAYAATFDGKSMQVLTGSSSTASYNVTANQPAFANLLTGLSMLSLVGAPSAQLDATATQALVSQAGAMIQQAQSQLTATQGMLGATQAQLATATTIQQSAATATSAQITKMEASDPATDITQFDSLQTQLQASYEVTAAIAKLSFTNYMPTLTG